MKKFKTDFEATHHDWLVNQLAQKQAAAMEASEAAAAAKRAVAHRVKKMTTLQEKAKRAAREVTAVNEAIKHFKAEQARKVKELSRPDLPTHDEQHDNKRGIHLGAADTAVIVGDVAQHVAAAVVIIVSIVVWRRNRLRPPKLPAPLHGRPPNDALRRSAIGCVGPASPGAVVAAVEGMHVCHQLSLCRQGVFNYTTWGSCDILSEEHDNGTTHLNKIFSRSGRCLASPEVLLSYRFNAAPSGFSWLTSELGGFGGRLGAWLGLPGGFAALRCHSVAQTAGDPVRPHHFHSAKRQRAQKNDPSGHSPVLPLETVPVTSCRLYRLIDLLTAPEDLPSTPDYSPTRVAKPV
ncbi:g11832 [Coccomyxa elongata]